MNMLSNLEIDQFKEDGAVHVRGFFSPDEVERWRTQILEHFHCPTDEEAWRQAVLTHRSGGLHLANGPSPMTHPALRQLYADLHVRGPWIGKSELRIRPPDVDLPWTGARTPHIDFPIFGSVRTLANNMIYLSNVTDRGGAFMYWPGSHKVAWNYFQKNPLDYRNQGSRGSDETFELLRRAVIGDPVQFLGAPGDILVWHALTLHSASVNLQPSPRLALIGRWGTPVEDDDEYFNFDEDMWSRWDFVANP